MEPSLHKLLRHCFQHPDSWWLRLVAEAAAGKTRWDKINSGVIYSGVTIKAMGEIVERGKGLGHEGQVVLMQGWQVGDTQGTGVTAKSGDSRCAEVREARWKMKGGGLHASLMGSRAAQRERRWDCKGLGREGA